MQKDFNRPPIGPFDDWENMCGNPAQQKYDLNIVSTITIRSSSRDQFKVFQEENKLIQDCKTMCLFLTDGQITFITCDHSYDHRPICERSLIARGLGFRETPTPHKPHLSSCTFILSQTYCSSQDFSICLVALSSEVSALCFAHKQYWIL